MKKIILLASLGYLVYKESTIGNSTTVDKDTLLSELLVLIESQFERDFLTSIFNDPTAIYSELLFIYNLIKRNIVVDHTNRAMYVHVQEKFGIFG